MIAKCLQNLANLVEFGAKESYMEVVNPFILKNKERMVVFLDHLSVSLTRLKVDFVLNFWCFFQSVREKPYPDEERVKGDPARDLAIVHHLCETSLPDLQSFARSVVRSILIFCKFLSILFSQFLTLSSQCPVSF